MKCADFDAKIDLYLDDMLSGAEMSSAAAHAKGCRSCDDIVTGYQQARALLTTAVADRAAAVDVSGLWESIEASLDGHVEPVRETRADRGVWSIGGFAAQLADAAASVRSLFGEGLTPGRLGAYAAVAAAVVMMIVISAGGPDGSSGRAKVASRSAGTPTLEAKPVRIDSMEVAAGHTVTTWSKPRTRTQVIWLGDDGFSVSNANHTR